MSRKEGIDKKTWGHEDIIITNDLYCTKYLVFDEAGGKTSMHFHKEKHETWYVLAGSFIVRWIETGTGEVHEQLLNEKDSWVNEPLEPHQLIANEPGSTILETSTADSVEDNYRVYR